MNALHYSNNALLRHCGGILLMTALVAGDFLSGRHHAFNPTAWSPVIVLPIVAVTLYLVVATIAMTLSLVKHGAIAVGWDADGVTYHTAWTRRRFAWTELSQIALDVRHTRNAHYFVVVLRRAHALQNCFSIDVRMLAETFDQAGSWVDGAERQRLARGGAPYVAPTGLLSGWVANDHAQEVAAARAQSRAA